MTFARLAFFADAGEDFAHVLDLAEEGGRDVDRAFLRGGEGEAVAGPGVEFDELRAEFVFLFENDAGVVGGVAEFGDDDAFDRDAEALEDVADESVVRPVSETDDGFASPINAFVEVTAAIGYALL